MAGADIAIGKRSGNGYGVVVVYAFPSLELVEVQRATRKLRFPYVPGFLSFREIPVLAACLRKVKTPFDALICDGQGIAHPRGLGLASHIGLMLDMPTIGCAKSRLIGEHEAVGSKRGEFTSLAIGRRRVGSVLRTQDGIKPLYVSPGHRVDQAGARRLVLACAARYRLPEPTRRADREAAAYKKTREAHALPAA